MVLMGMRGRRRLPWKKVAELAPALRVPPFEVEVRRGGPNGLRRAGRCANAVHNRAPPFRLTTPNTATSVVLALRETSSVLHWISPELATVDYACAALATYN